MRRLIALWFSLVLASAALVIIIDLDESMAGNGSLVESQAYTVSEPFNISSDDEFHSSPMVSGGDGSAGNPWIIENLEIEGNGSSNCIVIMDTSDHFILRNCFLHGVSPGLALVRTSNAVIHNNTITTNNSTGISILGSENNTIDGNNITGNYNGIFFDASYYYDFEECKDNTISNNLLASNHYGIHITYLEGGTIQNNTLDNNVYGIYIEWGVEDLVIMNNTMFGDGISSINGDGHVISTSNTVNGKPIYYYKNHNGGTVPAGAGQIILANCTGMKVIDQNLSGGDVGVILQLCANITLTNITAVDNDYAGISLSSTANTTMNGINASNCGKGIIIGNWNSFCNQIENCTTNNNSITGISISGKENRIANTTCNGNGRNGIIIGGEGNLVEHSTILGNEYGITMQWASNNKIRFNNISKSETGIQMYSSDYNKVYGNEIWDNDFGITLWQSSNNSFYENNVSNSTGMVGCPPYYFNETDINIYPEPIWWDYSLLETYIQNIASSSNAYQKAVDVNGVSVFDVHILGHANAVDLDMTVFLDGKAGQPKDGIAQWQEIITQDDMSFDAYASDYGTGFYAYCADGDADEAIRFINPLNGTYLIKVIGYTLTQSPAQFDMNITILNYTSSGIMALDSDCNNIVNNNITKNQIGLNLIESSELNLVHYNNIVGNGLNANDDGINLWNRDYPLAGNFWSDYTDSDAFSGFDQDQAGSDGIGDTPYTAISGSSGNRDEYPLMELTDGIYVDDEAPYSSLVQTTPYYGEGGQHRVEAIVRDNYSGVAYLEIWHRFSRDNITWDGWELLSNKSHSFYSIGWSFSWSAFDFPWIEGYHEFYSVAIDEECNREVKEEKAEASWGTDLEPPASIIANQTGYWHNSPLIINGTAHDNISGVAAVSLWYRHSADNATWTNWSGFGTDAETPWSWDFNYSEGDGHYEFDSISVDNVSHPESQAPYGWGQFESSLAMGYDSTPPVANAGANQWLPMGTVFTFNGTESTDNMSKCNLTWNFTYNNAEQILFDIAPGFTFDIPGIYHVTLNVTDLAGNWDVETVRLNVYDNVTPAAIAGPDRNATIGIPMTFDGSGSTDNVGIVNYTWTFTHNGTVVFLYGPSPSYTFWEVGNYTVTLDIVDAAGNTGRDTMVVSVFPPVAETQGSQWYFAIAIIAIIAAIILGLVVLKGRKSDVPDTKADDIPLKEG